MTVFISILMVLQSFAISLGVGSSTLAITNFFVAIADGTIDPAERRMMGVVYVVLRVAMVAILGCITAILALQWLDGSLFFTAAHAAALIIILVLYANALLMTMRIMPSTVGPGVQAGSWYALGTLQAFALQSITVTGSYFITFLLAYTAWLVLAVGIVNGIMAILKIRKRQRAATQ